MTFDMWRALPEALAAFDADPAVRRGRARRRRRQGVHLGRRHLAVREAARNATRRRPSTTGRWRRPTSRRCTAPSRWSRRSAASAWAAAWASPPRATCASARTTRCSACPRRASAWATASTGMRRFVNVIGAANTADIFFSARKFDAQEALRMGFVSRVVPAAELDARSADVLRDGRRRTRRCRSSRPRRAIREVLKDPGDARPRRRSSRRSTPASRARTTRRAARRSWKSGRRTSRALKPPRPRLVWKRIQTRLTDSLELAVRL